MKLGPSTSWWAFALLATLWVLTGCGGGGASASADAPTSAPPSPPAPPSYRATKVTLNSEQGDPIGGGVNRSFDASSAVVSVRASTGSAATLIELQVTGDTRWTGAFMVPGTGPLTAGQTYTNAPFLRGGDESRAAMRWEGSGPPCLNAVTSFSIDRATYRNGELVELALRFDIRCWPDSPALKGDVSWSADDPTKPAGPVGLAPSGLWNAPSDALPPAGNAAYLEGDPKSRIATARRIRLSTEQARFFVDARGEELYVNLSGVEEWSAMLSTMVGQGRLQPGYYGNLLMQGAHNPARGGLYWRSNSGYGCSNLSGWYMVDAVRYVGTTLTHIELRFEQRCDGDEGAFRGKLRWTAADPNAPQGPQQPVPTGLWTGPSAQLPSAESYVYLESESGDPVGQGRSTLLDLNNSSFALALDDGAISIGITGIQNWTGRFVPMKGLGPIQTGLYANLKTTPGHDPSVGGIGWSTGSSNCASGEGWFAIDRITLREGRVQELQARFEQRCAGATGALRGRIRWDANDRLPSGTPQDPPPLVWQPPPNALPASGNAVYLESEAGDYIGEGRPYLYTPLDSLLSVSTDGERLVVQVRGDQSWEGSFRPMQGLPSLRPGYYGNLGNYDPARGGLTWHGEGRGCTPAGWFVVDRIEYSGQQVTLLNLRFEHRCSHSSSALRGAVRWSAGDTRSPNGPTLPAPTGLWSATDMPPSGNALVLAGEPGEFVSGGQRYKYTSQNAKLTVSNAGSTLSVQIQGDEQWSGNFSPMAPATRLERGYYGQLMRHPFHNPARGGMDWSGEGRGCNKLEAWFVVDEVEYEGDRLIAVAMRFRQNCLDRGDNRPKVYGQLRWRASEPAPAWGPSVPVPRDLWQPSAGATPAGAGFLYIKGDPDEYVSAGVERLYLQQSSPIRLDSFGGSFALEVGELNGSFRTMDGVTKLMPGYYGPLMRDPFHNPARGGMSWGFQGRGCNRSLGWLAIDSVTYVNGQLATLDLRFEQHCDGSPKALRGQLRWIATPQALAAGRPFPKPAR